MFPGGSDRQEKGKKNEHGSNIWMEGSDIQAGRRAAVRSGG